MKRALDASPPGSVQEKTSAKPSGPPKLNYDEFRRKIVGLQDPLRHPGETEKVEVKQAAIRLCSILAHLFGEELDRLTLWGRIGTAFETALAKTSDDDLDRFSDLCLEHVQADPGRAAACDALTQERATWAARPPEWRHAFLGYVASHRYAVLAHGRQRWDEVKAKRVEL